MILEEGKAIQSRSSDNNVDGLIRRELDGFLERLQLRLPVCDVRLCELDSALAVTILTARRFAVNLPEAFGCQIPSIFLACLIVEI